MLGSMANRFSQAGHIRILTQSKQAHNDGGFRCQVSFTVIQSPQAKYLVSKCVCHVKSNPRWWRALPDA